MDEILDAPVKRDRRFNYAGFWIRFVAMLVDGLILWGAQVLISYIFLGSYSVSNDDLSLSFINLVVGFGYFAGMESSSRQGTLGKILFNLRVVDTNGEGISFANALGRYLAKFLSAILLLLGYFMVAWDLKKQGLHDKLAGTYVSEN